MRNDIDKLCMDKWKCGIYWSKQENGNCVWSIRHENQDYKLKLEISIYYALESLFLNELEN